MENIDQTRYPIECMEDWFQTVDGFEEQWKQFLHQYLPTPVGFHHERIKKRMRALKIKDVFS